MGSIIHLSKNLSNQPFEFAIYNEEQFHWHNSLEIVIALRGNVKVNIGYRLIDLKEDQICIIDSNRPHYIRCCTKNSCYLSIVFSNPKYFSNLIPRLKGSLLEFNPLTKYFNYEKTEQELKFRIAKLIHVYQISSDEKSTCLNINSLIEFIIENCDIYNCNAFGLNDYRRDGAKIITNYLYQNFQKKITLSTIADLINVSTSHLSHMVKQTTGRSFQYHLAGIRSEQSLKLLLNSNESITKISYFCGFSDPKYYNKMFKLFMGLTPYEYRKKFYQLYQNHKQSNLLDLANTQNGLELLKTKIYKHMQRLTTNDNTEIIDIEIVESLNDFSYKKIPELIINDLEYLNRARTKDVLDRVLNNISFETFTLTNLLFNTENSMVSVQTNTENSMFSVISDTVSYILKKKSNVKWFISKDEINSKQFNERFFNVYSKLSSLIGSNFLITCEDKGIMLKLKGLGIYNVKVEHRDFKQNSLYDSANIVGLLMDRHLNNSDTIKYIKLIDKAVNENEIFIGDCGLFTSNGLIKPAFHFLYLLNQIGDTLLYKGNNVLVMKSKNSYELLVYNLSPLKKIAGANNALSSKYHEHVYESNLRTNVILKGLNGPFILKNYMFNKRYGSVISLFNNEEVVKALSKNDISELNTSSIAKIMYSKIDKIEDFVFEFNVPEAGVEIIKLYPYNKKS